MNLEEAEDLAARTLTAINGWNVRRSTLPRDTHVLTADRERVASDLAGVQQHYAEGHGYCRCGRHHCLDARRYAEGLLRTARLYGVSP